jgi:hypothetical protein
MKWQGGLTSSFLLLPFGLNTPQTIIFISGFLVLPNIKESHVEYSNFVLDNLILRFVAGFDLTFLSRDLTVTTGFSSALGILVLKSELSHIGLFTHYARRMFYQMQHSTRQRISMLASSEVTKKSNR